MKLALSDLSHTWLIDVDGTLLKHNGYQEGGDALLPGVCEFWENIPENDHIILLSARPEHLREITLSILKTAGLRFNVALFGLPVGERILINDQKPRGLLTAVAVNLDRNEGLQNLQLAQD